LLDEIKDKQFDYFIDIGGGIGEFSQAIVEISPNTHVFIYEPFIDGYNKIRDMFHGFQNVSVFNEAFGNGFCLYLKKMPRWDQNMFVEKKISKDDVKVVSRDLKFIIDDNKIDIGEQCGLKMDCEGGEWYLLDDPNSVDLLKKFSYIAIEVHFKPKKDKNPQFANLRTWTEFNSWIENAFNPLFNIQYVNSSRAHGHGVYVLNKN
jgi:FkbM family methyltransferase